MIDQLTETIIKLAALSGACSALAATLPKPVNEGLWMLASKLINWLAFNIGNAKNK